MKKQLLTIFLLSCAIFANAQENSKTYYEKMKSMTSELDSTKFSNNILYDRVFPLANLNGFNQGVKQDTSNVNHFFQAINELDVCSQKGIGIDADVLNQLKYNIESQNKVPIGILNVDFTYFKPEVYNVQTTLIEIDSTSSSKKYIEKPEINPYINSQAFVI